MFTDIALPEALENNLKTLGFLTPTEVQDKVVPVMLEGEDLLVSAPTGSGKTAAYLVPLITGLVQSASHQSTQALILVPVRELAEQIFQTFQVLAKGLNVEAVVLVGGEDFKRQEKQLASANVVIATPGRVMPHIENESMVLDDLEYLILDEADRMLETGFQEAIHQIASLAPVDRQTVLVSATLPNTVRKLASELLVEAQWVKVGQQRQVSDQITQSIVLADDPAHKDKLLCWLLANETYDKAIVFCNSKTEARRLDGFLRYHKFKAALLHGDVQQKGRFATLEGFKKGTTTVLVTTDLASRGIDVEGVELVINTQMPRKGDLYIHRVGRTGRAKKQGQAISLIDASEWNLMSSIERYLKVRFRRKQIEGLIANYKGPKKLKASGKAVGQKKRSTSSGKKPAGKKSAAHKPKK